MTDSPEEEGREKEEFDGQADEGLLSDGMVGKQRVVQEHEKEAAEQLQPLTELLPLHQRAERSQ